MVQNIFRFDGEREPNADEIAEFNAVLAQIGQGRPVPYNFMVDLTRAARKLPFPYLIDRIPDVLSQSRGLTVPVFEMAHALGCSKDLGASDQILNDVLLRNLKETLWPKGPQVTSRRMARVFDEIAGTSLLQGISGMGSTSSMRVFTDISKFSDRLKPDQILTLALESAKLADQVVSRVNPHPIPLENIRRALDYYGHLALDLFPEPRSGALTSFFHAVQPIWSRIITGDDRFNDFGPRLVQTLPETDLKKQVSRILNPYLTLPEGEDVPDHKNGLDVALLRQAGYNGDMDSRSLSQHATAHFASQNVHVFPPRRPK